ncbi:hypothetical protein AAC387_Pa01g3808 [Persea americana]
MEGGDSERYWMIMTLMSNEEQKSLVRFLNHNSDVFAWTPLEMAGVDPKAISHKLGINPKAKPVMRKQRKLAPERRMAVCEEVDKLLEVDAIEKFNIRNGCPIRWSYQRRTRNGGYAWTSPT